MSPLCFSANLSWLFLEEEDLRVRFRLAAAAGFRAVEVAWPYSCGAEELRETAESSGLKVALINTPAGNLEKGDLGLGAVPGRQQEFQKGLAQAVSYAKALDCKRIHIMAGRIPAELDRKSVAKEMETTFVENLKFAASVLEQDNIMGLLEPINSRITDPQYYLNTPQQAVAILQKVGSPNLKLQMDIFHWQIMDGNLTQNIQTYFPLIGHIQIAQVPNRDEPDSPGELNFPYLFDLLEKLEYEGFVGCEYSPRGGTVEGLCWLQLYWKNRGLLAEEAN
ncbi:putative hydroxypyruvate isomerase [Microcaecilia unicolor]|uniref:Putative hydroxypyruvate isomerase n=1 Tax=Microcaecilia unicolor TaxID=1415580 RepID=A0A6P7Y418_9AMPH|nr:putative hydroxypyruvate isomerase [Microcaecilia unicolor]